MKSGALVFLAAFIALSASWGGFVLAPQLQLGRAPQEKATGTDNLYPVARAGFAKQGAEVYRSLGCVYCHSQTVGQDKTICEIILEDVGTNAGATLAALLRINAELAKPETLASLPMVVRVVADVPAAIPLMKSFTSIGGKVSARVVPQGPDVARAWGVRRSVAQDFAYDEPVQVGIRRYGPDLANVGMRLPDANWHLRHLYAPKSVVPDSTMPPYRSLFERRRITREPSSDALQLPSEPEAGYEIMPTDAARALAAYLVSLRSDAPLYEAPFTSPTPPAPATNAPASTNSPAK